MAWMDGKLDKHQNARACKCGAKSEHGVYVENELIGEYCNKCYADYLLDYKSCVDYIRGFLDAENGTREQAAQLASVFSGIDIRAAMYAAQHSLHTDAAWPPNHRDEPFCECSVCMGFTTKPAAPVS